MKYLLGILASLGLSANVAMAEGLECDINTTVGACSGLAFDLRPADSGEKTTGYTVHITFPDGTKQTFDLDKKVNKVLWSEIQAVSGQYSAYVVSKNAKGTSKKSNVVPFVLYQSAMAPLNFRVIK